MRLIRRMSWRRMSRSLRPGDSNGSDKSSAAGANGLGESGSGGSEEGSDKGWGSPGGAKLG